MRGDKVPQMVHHCNPKYRVEFLHNLVVAAEMANEILENMGDSGDAVRQMIEKWKTITWTLEVSSAKSDANWTVACYIFSRTGMAKTQGVLNMSDDEFKEVFGISLRRFIGNTCYVGENRWRRSYVHVRHYNYDCKTGLFKIVLT